MVSLVVDDEPTFTTTMRDVGGVLTAPPR
jgi:hypothetical protein